MPLHDWTLTDAGIYHAFHTAWIGELQKSLNQRVLPSQYYALAEQSAGEIGPDVLTLERGSSEPSLPPSGGAGIALADAPPEVSYLLEASEDAEALMYAHKARHLVIRHSSGREIIALIELVSPGNRLSVGQVDRLVNKAVAAVVQGIHVLLIDPFPPSRHAPNGIHSVIWEELSGEIDPHDSRQMRLLSSCRSSIPVRAYVEQQAVGTELTPMPLFLAGDEYVAVPLEQSYQEAFARMPQYLQCELQ